MADFPASLKPSVSQGYSFGLDENVLTQDVQGGPPLMMLDYAEAKAPINIGLVLTPDDLQVFWEFYVNDIDNGAEAFNINIDTGLGLTSHTVVIDSNSVSVDGSRSPIWTMSFTVFIDNSTPPIIIPDGFNTATANPELIFTDQNTTLVQSTNGEASAYAINPLVRDTYWEHTYKDTQVINVYMGISELSLFEDSTRVGWYTGSVGFTYGTNNLRPRIDNVIQTPIPVTIPITGDTYAFKYTHSTRAVEISVDGTSTWLPLYIIPNANTWHMTSNSQTSAAKMHTAFILSDVRYTVPSGFSTYDNDYTAP
jgi:hypothetical protein